MIALFNPVYVLIDSSLWFDTINLGWSCVYIKGSQVIISKWYFLSFSEYLFILANSVDSDKMGHYATFHLGLHYLPKYAFRSHQYIQRIKTNSLKTCSRFLLFFFHFNQHAFQLYMKNCMLNFLQFWTLIAQTNSPDPDQIASDQGVPCLPFWQAFCKFQP